jgi:hypothetical protein
LMNNIKYTVPSESIHTPWLFPYFVALQPECKIHWTVTAFVCWRKRVRPKCSVLVTHDFNELNRGTW